MYKLHDRANYIKEELKNMENDFESVEIYGLDNFRQIAQNILKKVYETEKFKVSGSVEQICFDITKCISKKIFPDNVVVDILYQETIQNQSRRDFHTNNLDLAYQSTSKKINLMNTEEIFEFFDTVSKKNLYDTTTRIVAKPIPKTEVVKPTPRRIEVKLTPVES